jgi:predicted alpha-1,2-mannosidase
MKIASTTVILILAIFSGCRLSPKSDAVPAGKINLVNPFIGTGGHGHTFPGATVPYGMVQLSPDTRLNGWDACSGYHDSDHIILGFTHTHLSGTGIGDYGDILMMPTSGEQKVNQGDADNPGYRSQIDKASEVASPGYYAVHLKDYGIDVALTATTHAGLHKYTFPAGKKAGVIIDVGHTLQSHHNAVNRIEIINDREIRGYKVTNGWARQHHVFFHAIFSEPFTHTLAVGNILLSKTEKVDQPGAKALLSFNNLAGNGLLVKVGISAVDYEGARNNVTTEIPSWDFDAVKSAAGSEWEKWLTNISIEGGTSAQQRIFYTALYHTAISPNTFSDADGRYRGMDKKTHTSTDKTGNHTVFSLWDTFRAFHPLMTIINPTRNEAWIRTMLQKYDEGGVLPMWELASNETGTMIGYHAIPVIVDAYRKGYGNFDVNKAYEAMVKSAEFDTTTISFSDAEVRNNVMPVGKYYNDKLGFIPCDKENESVSKALEYAYNDWCIAQMAKALGKTKDYDRFMERSKRYATYFDKTTGFMRGLTAERQWKTPFNPRFSNHRSDDYVEGNAWQWSWFVPHDVEGLIALHGGKEQFLAKLDSLFTTSSAVDGGNSSADISGLIGQYAHGNEPSHHIAYLYNYAGKPWRTQELVDEILTTLYFNDANGLSGNEDCGQMSAWYIMSSMGLYQVSPGEPTYTLGRPLFNGVTLQLGDGKTFRIQAINNSAVNKYVKQVTLNGKVLNTPFITHNDILNGGILEFTMDAVHP